MGQNGVPKIKSVLVAEAKLLTMLLRAKIHFGCKMQDLILDMFQIRNETTECWIIKGENL